MDVKPAKSVLLTPNLEYNDVIVPPLSVTNKDVVLPATENDCEVYIPLPPATNIDDNVVSSSQSIT